ncbi:MAG: hypothetical protein F6K26_20485 [Moorea sp. SIO2I5]|nr:hypothetical protein [Moorena sp. SIO2I5]
MGRWPSGHLPSHVYNSDVIRSVAILVLIRYKEFFPDSRLLSAIPSLLRLLPSQRYSPLTKGG